MCPSKPTAVPFSDFELLRDLYVWAYKRSTQEYLAIEQDLAEPDPVRLRYRDLIKQTIRDVVLSTTEGALTIIRREVAEKVTEPDRESVQALIIEELRRLHEGVLARYSLCLAEFVAWKERQKAD